MSGTAVLLCSGTEFVADALEHAPTLVVQDLCGSPAEAASFIRRLAATRVVLALCERGPSGDLVSALRRAGVSTFGVESVVVGGRDREEAALLIGAAVARLDALADDDNGKAAFATAGLSRRALLQLAPVVTHVPVAVVDEQACAGTGRCGLCVEACPEHAIDLTGPLPVVDAPTCTACGMCVPRCPFGALRLAGSSNEQIEAQLEQLLPGVTGIVLACRAAAASAPPGWALVELPTLELVSVGWLLQLRARGAEVRLAPCKAACCAGIHATEALANLVVSAVGAPRHDDGPVHLGEPLATADGVRRLAPRDATFVLDHAASPLGVVAMSPERCTLCGACVAACPTSALQLGGVAEIVLRHEPSACVACGRCVTACPEEALTVRRAVDVASLSHGTLELARALRERCAGCGSELPPLPMRRRLSELLPERADTPPDLCSTCAARRRAYDRSSALSERSN